MAVLITKNIGAFAVDVVIEEEHTSDLHITSLPVEKGADITDHAVIQPRVITIRGIAGKPLHGTSDFISPSDSYVRLLRVQELLERFDIQTGLALYRSMMVQNIQVTRTSANANHLHFTATLKQVRIVGSEYAVNVDVVKGGQVARLAASTLPAGIPTQRAAPTVQSGDRAVVHESLDPTTRKGAANLALTQTVIPEATSEGSLQSIDIGDTAGKRFTTVIKNQRIDFDVRYNSAAERFAMGVSVNGKKLVSGKLLATGSRVFANHTAARNAVGDVFLADIRGRGLDPKIENLANKAVKAYIYNG